MKMNTLSTKKDQGAMVDDLNVFSQEGIPEVVDQLRELLSQGKRLFLLGAGCSVSANLPDTATLTKSVLGCTKLSDDCRNILTSVSGNFKDAKSANIEDFLSEIIDHLAISVHRKEKEASKTTVAIGGMEYSTEQIELSLNDIKKTLTALLTDQEVNLEHYRKFVRSIHDTLQSGKSERGRSVDYFSLNYDTLLEDALALERKAYCDGFRGGPTGWWDQLSFSDETNSARVHKLHGSIDWCQLDSEILPCRMRPSSHPQNGSSQVMIWPAATKYQETQRDPFSQLFNQFRDALIPLPGSEAVIAVCGYSFGDSHVNVELERALKHSDKRLTLLAFTSGDEPTGQLEKWALDPGINEQVRIHANRGFFHGDKIVKTTDPLTWWKFETLSRLLAGEK